VTVPLSPMCTPTRRDAVAGLYVDPTQNPLRFLPGVRRAMALMAASEWGGLAPEVGLTLPLAGLSRSLRARASTRFMLLGAPLAVLPSCPSRSPPWGSAGTS